MLITASGYSAMQLSLNSPRRSVPPALTLAFPLYFESSDAACLSDRGVVVFEGFHYAAPFARALSTRSGVTGY